MASGGLRFGSGGKPINDYHINGVVYAGLKGAAAAHGVSKVTIRNWCLSKNKPDCWSTPKGDVPADIVKAASNIEGDPDAKAYLEGLLMAPIAEVDRKTKILVANILLPFQHARASVKGKKGDVSDKANEAGTGRLAPSEPPQLKAVK